MNDDVACLPDIFVPTSKPLKRLHNYFIKKQQQHEKALDQYHQQKRHLYDNHNTTIQTLAEECNKNLDHMKMCIKAELCDARNKVKEQRFGQICTNLHQHVKLMHGRVDELYERLQELEVDKSRHMKSALKHVYQELQQICHKTPFENDQLIELELEKINQTSLANARHYLDLKSKLQLQIQSGLKDAISDLHQIYDMYVGLIQRQSAQLMEESQTDLSKHLVQKMKSTTKNIGQNLNQLNDPQQWLDGLRASMFGLDKEAQKLMISYKQAAVLIYEHFFEDLRDIGDSLDEVEEIGSITKVETSMYTPTLEEIEEKYKANFTVIQNTWTKLVDEISKTVEQTYKFLKVVSKLWQRHFMRLEILQFLIMKDLTNNIQKNNDSSETFECKMNTILDTMRQESSQDKLRKTMEELRKVAKSIENCYRGQYQMEVNVMKKYKTVSEVQSELLEAEMNRFLTLHPPDLSKDPKIQRKRASKDSQKPPSTENLIPNQMVYCQYQVEAITNWQYGLWEGIDNYSKVAKAEANAEMDKWIEEQTSKLEKRLTVRLGIHQMRLEKIEVVIFQQRMEELGLHEERLETHQKAVEGHLGKAKEDFKLVKDSFEQTSNQFKEYCDELYIKAIESSQEHQIVHLITLLSYEHKQSLDKLDTSETSYNSGLDQMTMRIKASHVVYLEQVQMFMEQGTFSVPEATDVMKMVVKMQQHVEKVVGGLKKDVDKPKTINQEKLSSTNQETHYALDTMRKELRSVQEVTRRQKFINRSLKTIVCSLINQIATLDKSFQLVNKGGFNQFCQHMRDVSARLVDLGAYLRPKIDSKTISSQSEGLVQNRTLELFGEEVVQGTYIGDMMWLLKKQWEETLEYYERFFEEHHNHFFYSSDLIFTDVNSLVTIIYPIFVNYKQQVESRLLQDLKDFIGIACKFQTFFRNTMNNYLTGYTKQSMDDFRKYHEEQLQLVEQLTLDVQSQFAKLHQQLRPIYGHPKHRGKLEKLEVDAHVIISDAEDKLEEILAVDLDKLGKLLQEMIQGYKALTLEVDRLQPTYNDIKATYVSCLNIFKDKIRMGNVLDRYESFLTELDGQVDEDDMRINHASHSSKDEMVEVAQSDSFQSKMENTFEEFSGEIGKQSLKGLLEKLKKEWDGAVKRVLELYSVKYDRSKVS